MPDLLQRMGGRLRVVKPTYGIVVGDDAQHYFFMPTDVVAPSSFEGLRENQPVQFSTYECTRNVDGVDLKTVRATRLVVVAVDPIPIGAAQQHHHHG